MTLELLTPGRRLVGSYAALPRLSGPSFLFVSFLSRLPTTMAPLAVLTFVVVSTGSFAAGGLAATALAGGTAVGAPVMGRLADRVGQRPVLVVAALVNPLALVGLLLLGGSGSGTAGLLMLCAAVGLSMPPVGGMARARWLALSRRHAGTAMAYEGTADELAYVLGPAAAGILASGRGAGAALLAAAVGGALAVGAFAVHPTHRATVPAAGGPTPPGPAVPRPRPAADPATDPENHREGRRAVLVSTAGMLLMGMFFSATQTAVLAFATAAGRSTSAGLIYALLAVGSAVTALGTAALPDRFGARARCAVAAAGLLGGVGLMFLAGPVSGSLPWLCAAVLVTGLSVGPVLVTLHQVAGAAAPAGRTATTMAQLTTGGVLGIAVGATAAGTLTDAVGGRGALAVAGAASAALLALAFAGLRRPRDHRPRR